MKQPVLGNFGFPFSFGECKLKTNCILGSNINRTLEFEEPKTPANCLNLICLSARGGKM